VAGSGFWPSESEAKLCRTRGRAPVSKAHYGARGCRHWHVVHVNCTASRADSNYSTLVRVAEANSPIPSAWQKMAAIGRPWSGLLDDMVHVWKYVQCLVGSVGRASVSYETHDFHSVVAIRRS
jgi:hypothetical protein